MSDWFTRKRTRNPYDPVYQAPHTDYTALSERECLIVGKIPYTLDGKDIDGLPASVDIIVPDGAIKYCPLSWTEALVQIYDVDLSRPYAITDLGDGRHRVQQTWELKTLEEAAMYGGIAKISILKEDVPCS